MHFDDFRVHLERLGISQAEFSRRLGLSRNTVGSWRGGEVPGYASGYLALMGRHDLLVKYLRRELGELDRGIGDLE